MTAFTQLKTPMEQLGPPEEWCRWYRALGLPAFLRGEFVELRTNEHVAALMVPSILAEGVAEHLDYGPALSSTGRTWAGQCWRFLVQPDRLAGDPLDSLALAGVSVLAAGAAVLLPTGPDRRDREGCWWVQLPVAECPLPTLSTVLAITVREQDRLRDQVSLHSDATASTGRAR